MHVVNVSKRLFNAIALPGMGRSIEMNDLSDQEIAQMLRSFSQKALCVEFTEEPGTQHPVVQLWANPHGGGQITLFV